MYEIIFLLILALVWIAFATIQDLKKREVANWLNFSLIIFVLGFRFFYSLFSQTNQDFTFFYQGLIGLSIFFVLGNLFYYGRMFAGGDAKLMIALGVVLPFTEDFFINLRIFILFFFIFIFILPYFYLYVKAVDEVCMTKIIKINQAREGDWLYEDLKIENKIIKSAWDGLSKKDIELIGKNFKKIKIRQGIPFVPVFLFSFLILIIFYFLKIEFLNLFW